MTVNDVPLPFCQLTLSRVVSSLAANLDLNSLHNLSRTCRQFRGTLLLFRDQLITRTLRCSNDSLDQGDMELQRVEYDSPYRPTATAGRSFPRVHSERLTSGRISKCARDLVADCRRCGLVVCRVRSQSCATKNYSGLLMLCRTVKQDSHPTGASKSVVVGSVVPASELHLIHISEPSQSEHHNSGVVLIDSIVTAVHWIALPRP